MVVVVSPQEEVLSCIVYSFKKTSNRKGRLKFTEIHRY